ncbi:potassium transporter [Nitrosococcus watsonii C-113]|uniref:Probable potassium transport system protein Kup n=2 Tax=Nitrosococcus TaxID=1227 RepID=D8K513_NITWC|nr:potassium transporter [Nitrosococcus watsonii C-113]
MGQALRTSPSATADAALALAALGVVFGDIGTSPLYALRACFLGTHPVVPTAANVLGLLSLITWALIVVVTLKYVTFLLRIDNHGEGGILALLARLRPRRETRHPQRRWLVLLGIGGAALLYGDGVITPAISVLSAVEGLTLTAPLLRPAVLPVTVLILLVLFFAQARGTARIAALFGPLMLVWFLILAALGVSGIALRPEVLAALAPHHAMRFLFEQGGFGLLVLGAVFLAVTGGEALYADMGQFGRRPIRLAWFGVALPALLLNYFGQGALLLQDPRTTEPFFHLAPGWALPPLVLLATVATVIASQAVITGAFSLTRQAIQLGLCPRLQIRHTSADAAGQIYLPAVNTLLLIGTLALVLGFGSSERLAAAYGFAVSGTMLLTTLLIYAVARQQTGWSRWRVGLLASGFLLVDLAFFLANGPKIADGGWVSVLIGGSIFILLTTWHRGRELLAQRRCGAARRSGARLLPAWLAELGASPPPRVHGTAVFLTTHRNTTPPVLLHHLRHNQALHRQVVLLTVLTDHRPRVPLTERFTLDKLGFGFFRLSVHYGFMESPNVPAALAACAPLGVVVDPARTTYYVGRWTVIAIANRTGMTLWRERLFAFLSRNALPATAFFRLPPEQVMELGMPVEI